MKRHGDVRLGPRLAGDRLQAAGRRGGDHRPAPPRPLLERLGFPSALYLFYGGDIREGALPWLRAQITELAAMPPADDGDRPAGQLLITDERGDEATWHVRDGSLIVS
ncbi:hypothetical protein [Paractinoplanes durhamensis]|uniref:Uncharacterized protein n=1 Tax=Paractinoplanes durhamensis TaxID=113563 RepID=A0ABQ3YZM7_9ACTN|nr:hypothetical protein [Actinoplanes durhamensis]GIE03016.1 hypothetical protein Adu01nite_43660 [Actinoplanes durhamensis]